MTGRERARGRLRDEVEGGQKRWKEIGEKDEGKDGHWFPDAGVKPKLLHQ